MRYFLLTLCVVFLFVACTKNSNPAKSRADILRSGRWYISSATITGKVPNGKDTTMNYFNFMPKCHQDDFLTFTTGNNGAIHSNGTVCSPHDPDSVSFQWTLGNNDNNISLFRGFDLVWSYVETVQPYQFDTTQINPYLVLDTVHGVNDTLPGFTRSVIVLDTIWKLHFDSLYVPNYDIYNAPFASFSDNTFTMNFTMLATYPDTTNFHTGTPPPNLPPVIRPDTFKYVITFNKQ